MSYSCLAADALVRPLQIGKVQSTTPSGAPSGAGAVGLILIQLRNTCIVWERLRLSPPNPGGNPHYTCALA